MLGGLQSVGDYCRPMINKPPSYKGLNIRNPIISPIMGRGFINHGSGLDNHQSLNPKP